MSRHQAGTSRRDDLAEARRYRDQAERAATDHGWRLRALEPLFGVAVRAAADEHLERVTESSSESWFYYERHCEASERDGAALRSRLADVERERDRFRDFALVVARRSSTAGCVQPAWFREALAKLCSVEAKSDSTGEVPF